MALTDEQRKLLGEWDQVAFGPWEQGDADDPEMLDAIVFDIRTYAEGDDTDWVTMDHVAEYLSQRTG